MSEDIEHQIAYHTEMRRHYLALAAAEERLISQLRGAVVAPRPDVVYNTGTVTTTPPLEYK